VFRVEWEQHANNRLASAITARCFQWNCLRFSWVVVALHNSLTGMLFMITLFNGHKSSIHGFFSEIILHKTPSSLPHFLSSHNNQRMASGEESRSRFHQVQPSPPVPTVSSLSFQLFAPFCYIPCPQVFFKPVFRSNFSCPRRYYTQTRAIGAFASVGAEKMADACSQGVLGCLKSCVCWGKRTVDVKQIRQRKMEMQKMTQANDGEDDHLNLI
jgi:hypothetical protein